METKICTKCKQDKELELFHRRATSEDGRATQCAKCANRWNRMRDNKTPEYLAWKIKREEIIACKLLERVNERNNGGLEQSLHLTLHKKMCELTKLGKTAKQVVEQCRCTLEVYRGHVYFYNRFYR